MTRTTMLRELTGQSGVRLIVGNPNAAVNDVVEDSRLAVPGSLFVARIGARHDGHAFVDDAVARGAVAVLASSASDRPLPRGIARLIADDLPLAAAHVAERVYGWPGSALDLIGITGTKGKTTTAHLVRQILDQAGTKCGLMGTVENHDGRVARPASLTTLAACDTSRLLRTMADHGCAAAAMEVSSHALAQGRVAALRFKVAAFTNLSGDHLDFHRTMGAYADAKAILFESLDPSAVAVLNADDAASARMVGNTRARVVRCSMENDSAEFHAHIRSLNERGARCTLTSPTGRADILLPLLGRHNVANALIAAAIATSLDVPMASVASALEKAIAPPGRFEIVRVEGAPFSVLVDYAHTDASLDSALVALCPLVARGSTLRVVFGCGGDRDRTKRPRMAAAACRHAGHVIITSDNPRTESPLAIIDEILTGVDRTAIGSIDVVPDRRDAIHAAVAASENGDILLIAGKGHEDYQIIGHEKRPFDDRVVAREAMLERLHATSIA